MSYMPTIDYAPNDNAKCRGCFGKIGKGCVRVGVKHNYQTQYFHASCYTGRSDFSNFSGWNKLGAEDQETTYATAATITTTATATATRTTTLKSIRELLPCGKEGWKIHARVIYKSEIQDRTSKKTKGVSFSIDLIDSSSAIISAFFNHQAVLDQFYILLEIGKCYCLAGTGDILQASPSTSSPCKIVVNDPNDIQITPLTTTTTTTDNPNDIPVQLPYKFCKLANLPTTKNNNVRADVLAVVAHISMPSSSSAPPPPSANEIGCRRRRHQQQHQFAQTPLQYDILLVDDSHCSVLWTLTNPTALPVQHQVVAVWRACVHVSETNDGGRSCSLSSLYTSDKSELLSWEDMSNHPHPRAQQLVQWYQAHCATALSEAWPLTVHSVQTWGTAAPESTVETVAVTTVALPKQSAALAKSPQIGNVTSNGSNNKNNNNQASLNPVATTKPDPSAAAVLPQCTNASKPAITLIRDLRRSQPRPTIQALVLQRDDTIQHWSSSRTGGHGFLFHLELIDASGVNILATFFLADQEVQAWQYFQQFQVGHVYRLSGGKVRTAKPPFNRNCQSQFQLSFNCAHATMEQVTSETKNSGSCNIELPYDFIPLDQLSEKIVHAKRNDAVVDILAIVAKVEETAVADTTNVTLVDASGYSILWNLYRQPVEQQHNHMLTLHQRASSSSSSVPPPPQEQDVLALWHVHGIIKYGGYSLVAPRYVQVLSEGDHRATELVKWWKDHKDTALQQAHVLSRTNAPLPQYRHQEQEQQPMISSPDSGWGRHHQEEDHVVLLTPLPPRISNAKYTNDNHKRTPLEETTKEAAIRTPPMTGGHSVGKDKDNNNSALVSPWTATASHKKARTDEFQYYDWDQE